MREQVIKLGKEDRKLVRDLVKEVHLFSREYALLWIVMCAVLFILIWVVFYKT